jgi:GNAT superfamily N-acetyltransferase
VAVENDTVVGFCTAGPSRDAAAQLEAEIYAIYLDPDVIGTGRGRRLFEHAVEDLRQLGYRRAELWVLPTNVRARRFYERAGWRHDGTERMDRVQDLQLPEVRYRVEL